MDLSHSIFKQQLTISELLQSGLEQIDSSVIITGRLTRFTLQKVRIFGTIADGSDPVGLQFVYHFPAKEEDRQDRGQIDRSIIRRSTFFRRAARLRRPVLR